MDTSVWSDEQGVVMEGGKKKSLNPFEPSRPASPDQFVGREKEVAELDAALEHLQCERPRHFLITGFRGVGKTSFLDLIRSRAGKNSGRFNFLVLDFQISKQITCMDLAKGIERELDRAVSHYAPFKDMVKKSWDFIQRIEAAGVSLKSAPSHVQHREIHEAVADAMCETVDKLCDKTSLVAGYDGILLLLDEVDQASDELDLGTFLKYLLEILNRRACHRVSIGLAGLASSREVLLRSHRSSLRIFDELPLGNLGRDEFDELLATALLKVQSDGGKEFELEESAKNALLAWSDGHPHFVHQFGYCAFERARDRPEDIIKVTLQDVMDGARNKRGAFDLIGDMYFRDGLQAVEDNKLALVLLDILAESPGTSFSANDLSAQIRLSDHIKRDIGNTLCSPDALTPLLKNMCALELLEEVDGEYRVRYRCFAYWLKVKRPLSQG